MIYFVGIHHKEGKPALCSSTRSGKKIDEVIAALKLTVRDYTKYNLFDGNYIPKRESEEYNIQLNRFIRSLHGLGPHVFVLLGNDVQKHFPHAQLGHHKLIYFRHPAFSGYHFIDDLVNAINYKL